MSYLCDGCDAYLRAVLDRDFPLLDPLNSDWEAVKSATTASSRLSALHTLRTNAVLRSIFARAAIQVLVNDAQLKVNAGRDDLPARPEL